MKKVSEAIAHRGPDAEGEYQDRKVDFLHRRLSIIDTSEKGNQPMLSEKKDIVIIYNGEIYNFRELRDQYLSDQQFQSQSDTEVILKLFEKFGEEAFSMLNGVFSIALWDLRDETMYLVRDRLGTRGLYYYQDAKHLIFSSEIRGILASNLVKAEIDEGSLIEYFTFQNHFGQETLFQNIKLLPPATILKIQNGEVSQSQYWQPVYETTKDLGKEHYQERMHDLVKNAVKRQTVRDEGVYLGSYLSGGLDSGAIVGFASDDIPHFLTFTCGWDMNSVSGMEAGFDERKMSELTASRFKTTHHEVILHNGDMQWMLPRVIRVEEELKLGMSYSNQYIARLASKFVKVCFSGAGGDELMGGYPWRYELAESCNTDEDFENIYYGYWSRLVPDSLKDKFFSQGFLERNAHRMDIARQRYREVFRDAPHFDNFINREMYFELKTFLHGLLTIEDKISMNYSMETRVPFLDHDLMDFCMKLPDTYRFDKGQGKTLLREALRGFLPDQIVDNKKQGFSSPDQSWYKGESAGYVRDMLLSDSALHNYIDKNFIEQMLRDHNDNQINHRLLIWSLLCFKQWHEYWVEGKQIELRRDAQSQKVTSF